MSCGEDKKQSLEIEYISCQARIEKGGTEIGEGRKQMQKKEIEKIEFFLQNEKLEKLKLRKNKVPWWQMYHRLANVILEDREGPDV